MHYDNYSGLACGDDDEGESDPFEIFEKPVKVPRKIFFTPRLAGALDNCAVTDRRAVHVISAIIDALDLDINNYVLNRTSLKNYREQIRQEIANSFIQNKDVND